MTVNFQNRCGVAAIYLGLPLPTGSSDLPAVNTRARYQRLGLAGGGVCPAGIVTDAAVRSYRTISPLPRTYLPRPSSQKSLSVIFILTCALAVAITKQIGAGRPPDPLLSIFIINF
jgi:hypothetical protein